MTDSPLVAVRAAEREASERISAAEAEAQEIVDQARGNARRMLEETRTALLAENGKRLDAHAAEAESAAARIHPEEPESDGPLVAAMLRVVLPEEA